MSRTALVAGIAGLVLGVAGCSEKRSSSSSSSSSQAQAQAPSEGSGRGSAEAVASPAPAPIPALPGTLWFVEDGPPRTLVTIAGGARREIRGTGGDLYPSPWQLPDGRLVAIASRGDGGPDAEQLALVGPDGAVERIGEPAAQVRDPAVDPEGRWIVVAANRDGHSDLYRIDLPGGKTTRLTNDPAGNFRPARLGGTGSIAFVSSRDGDAELYRMPVAGGNPQRLTAFHRDDWEPTPSPDGKTIAFLSDRAGRPRIYLVAADGTGVRRLTDRADADVDEIAPVWSPDGKSIAYVVERGGSESNAWVRDVAAGTERVITPLRARDAEPVFSPDGAWIATSRGSGHELELWATRVAGDGEAVRISSGGSARIPRWR